MEKAYVKERLEVLYNSCRRFEKLFGTEFDEGKIYKVEYEVEGYIIECVQSFKQKYVELHVPKDYAEKFEVDKVYKIYPKWFKEIGCRTRKKIFQRQGKIYYEAKIILPKGDGRKARIEIPKSLQKHYKIEKKKIVEIRLETPENEKFSIYTKTDKRPKIVPIPKKYAQKEKVKVKEMREYKLKDFITEYNKQKPIKQTSIKQDNHTLTLEIGEHKIEAKKYNFNTYGGKPYLEIEQKTENNITKYRIIKEDNTFKIYRLSGKGYEQIKDILISKNKIVFIAKHGKREKRHLFYKKEEKEIISLGDPDLFYEKIDNNTTLVIAKFSKSDFNNIIAELIERRSKERQYSKGTMGELVAKKVLKNLNYIVVENNHTSSRCKGDDITLLKDSKYVYVEVKYVTSEQRINYKLSQALRELNNRHKEGDTHFLLAIVVIPIGEGEFKLLLQAHSSFPKFFIICIMLNKT